MRLIIPYLAFFISWSGFGQADESKIVDQLHRKKFEWLTTKNYDSLNWILDDQVKYIHSNGWIQSKKDVIDDIKSGKLVYTSITVSEASVTQHGPKASIITGKGLFVGLMPDKSEFKINLLYTEVYVKYKKQWKLVSRQATRIN